VRAMVLLALAAALTPDGFRADPAAAEPKGER